MPRPDYAARCRRDPFLPRPLDKRGNLIAAAIRQKRLRLEWSWDDKTRDGNGVEWKIIHNHFKSEIYIHRNGEYYCHMPRIKRFQNMSSRKNHDTLRDRVVAELVIFGDIKVQGQKP